MQIVDVIFGACRREGESRNGRTLEWRDLAPQKCAVVLHQLSTTGEGLPVSDGARPFSIGAAGMPFKAERIPKLPRRFFGSQHFDSGKRHHAKGGGWGIRTAQHRTMNTVR